MTGSDPGWEHMEIVIPLNLKEGLTDKKIRPVLEQILADRVALEATQGWEVDEPTDISTLRRTNRIKIKSRGFFGPLYVSATLRFRRPRRPA